MVFGRDHCFIKTTYVWGNKEVLHGVNILESGAVNQWSAGVKGVRSEAP